MQLRQFSTGNQLQWLQSHEVAHLFLIATHQYKILDLAIVCLEGYPWSKYLDFGWKVKFLERWSPMLEVADKNGTRKFQGIHQRED